jgi:DNA-binding transcriptional regulator GbsR (MarR family)
MTSSVTRKRDPQAVARFIERFASALVDAGMARMPARVFVALLASDAGRMSSSELAELLGVSPAAISGAVRYLTQVNLASREREPGSRRDYYRVHEDTWYNSALYREQMLTRWKSSATEGVEALGRATPAGARIARSLAFFEFLQGELPAILERWQQRQAELD